MASESQTGSLLEGLRAEREQVRADTWHHEPEMMALLQEAYSMCWDCFSLLDGHHMKDNVERALIYAAAGCHSGSDWATVRERADDGEGGRSRSRRPRRPVGGLNVRPRQVPLLRLSRRNLVIGRLGMSHRTLPVTIRRDGSSTERHPAFHDHVLSWGRKTHLELEASSD